MEISKESVLSAIKKIDSNPDLLKGRTSSTYDLVFNGKKYPPILVLSEANKLNGGKELFLEDFKNGTNEAFKYLTNYDFEIKRKDASFYNELFKFLEQAKNGDLKTSHYIKEYAGLKIKVSFGQGGPANIPWISFLGDEQSTSNGIYPVYLYYKKIDLLILAYGVSVTNLPKIKWPLTKTKAIKDYFLENNLGIPFNYGDSFIFKTYNVKELPNSKIIDTDLNEILNFYNSIKFKKKERFMSIDYKKFFKNTEEAGLIFSEKIIIRFTASLCTKPFVICSGLSGSGKTKLAQAFVHWISENDTQYKIIPVGADWTNREPLLGYPNGLIADNYVLPDSGALQLIIEASKEENKNKPYFLILDEMNLSHVERYFADFLSIMESGDEIKLYSGNDREDTEKNKIPKTIKWPSNLFVIGTVNIDETTYMFSPKVLDRANVIEFRISSDEMKNFLGDAERKNVDLTNLNAQGASMGASFLTIAQDKTMVKNGESKVLNDFFVQLQKVGAEFGYRSATEIELLITKLGLDIFKDEKGNIISDEEKIDISIMQKLLPKLHGSRKKLIGPLEILAGFCIGLKQDKSISEEEKKKAIQLYISEKKLNEDLEIKYPISLEKIVRMYKNALDNGFTSYAEA